MDSSLPPRTYLFLPGNRTDRLASAFSSGADAVVLDLEDAIPPADKPQARRRTAEWLVGETPTYVRLNGAQTEWYESDLDLVSLPGVAGVVLPKAESPGDAERLVAAVARRIPVVLIIESALGFHRALYLASVPGVQRLVFGSLDFQADLGMRDNDDQLNYFRSHLVLVSRLAGILPPVDGVTRAIDDVDRLRADSLRARRMGYTGKICIHPAQVRTINACFSPAEDEIAWARRVVQAADAAGGGAALVDGKMVDRPVYLTASAILAEAERRAL